MKKIILLVLLAFAAIRAFTSCGGRKYVTLNNQDLPDYHFPYQQDYDGEWTVHPRWLYTENSFWAVCNWETEINQDYYFLPEKYVNEHMTEESVAGMRDLFMENLIDSVDSTRHKMPSEQVVYLANVKYEKTNINDDILSLGEPSDSLIDAVIGKLVVTMTIKSIGEESCNVPIKLFEYQLSKISANPIRDGLLLYIAQRPSYMSTFCGVTELSDSYINYHMN